MVSLVDADEAVGELKHVVAEGDDDELGILGPGCSHVCMYVCMYVCCLGKS